MKANNKITTQGYFIKRLRDSGYIVDRLYNNYSKADSRVWTVIIDPGGASIQCTFHKNRFEPDEGTYEFYDSCQYVPSNFQLKTSSVEVVIHYLNQFNIVDKSISYNERCVEKFNGNGNNLDVVSYDHNGEAALDIVEEETA